MNQIAKLANQLGWLQEWLRPGITTQELNAQDSGDRTLIISGLTRAEAVGAVSASRRAELINCLRQLTNFSRLTLVDSRGRVYDLPIERSAYWDALTNLSDSPLDIPLWQPEQPKECDRILQDIWENPTPTCLVQMDTGKLLLGNAIFAEQVGFRNPLEAWGLSVLSTWFPAELERLKQNLGNLPLGRHLGTQEEPYEYRGISLADVAQLMAMGVGEQAAIATARRVEIGAVCRQVVFGGQLCRVNTTYHFRYA